MDTEAEIRAAVTPRRVAPAGLRYDRIDRITRSFYRDLDPDARTDLDPAELTDLAIRAETDRIAGAVGGLGRVLVVGVNAGWPALRISGSVGSVLVVHPERAEVRLAERLSAERWGRPNVRVVEGDLTALPLAEGSVDAVVSDCALASWRDPGAIGAELARVLDCGGLCLAREANWAFELRGRAVVEETSFKRYGGRIYFGYTKRTLDPPREVEYICLLDHDNPWVANLERLPREVLRDLSPDECPRLRELLVSAEYFEVHHHLAETLADLLGACGLTSVEVGPSGFDAAVGDYLAAVRRDLEERGIPSLADVVVRSWQDYLGGRNPFLLATAVKAG